LKDGKREDFVDLLRIAEALKRKVMKLSYRKVRLTR
jgi:hypothetical protein